MNPLRDPHQRQGMIVAGTFIVVFVLGIWASLDLWSARIAYRDSQNRSAAIAELAGKIRQLHDQSPQVRLGTNRAERFSSLIEKLESLPDRHESTFSTRQLQGSETVTLAIDEAQMELLDVSTSDLMILLQELETLPEPVYINGIELQNGGSLERDGDETWQATLTLTRLAESRTSRSR